MPGCGDNYVMLAVNKSLHLSFRYGFLFPMVGKEFGLKATMSG